MPTIALTGADTVNMNGRNFSDFADQNFAELTFDNEIATLKTGKNKNVIYAENTTGFQATFKLRLIRGSGDDKYLNGLLAAQQNNFSATILNFGEFIKKIGDGLGNIKNDTYIVNGGIINKPVDAKSNAEGDTEQSVAIWNFKFATAARVIR